MSDFLQLAPALLLHTFGFHDFTHGFRTQGLLVFAFAFLIDIACSVQRSVATGGGMGDMMAGW